MNTNYSERILLNDSIAKVNEKFCRMFIWTFSMAKQQIKLLWYFFTIICAIFSTDIRCHNLLNEM